MTKKGRMFLIFHGRFPSERAAALFAAKSAEAFGSFMDVTLLVPRRLGRSKRSAFDYFDLKKNFKVVFLPTIDIFWLPLLSRLGFHISQTVFSLVCLAYLKFHASKEDIIYSNENLPLLILVRSFPNCFYEMHDFPGEQSYPFYRRLFKKVRWILIHNKWKAGKALEVLSVDREKILIEPNAVELEKFDIKMTKSEARSILGLSEGKKTIVYTGHLYGWKGADTLAEAALSFAADFMFYFVGGTETEVKDFRRRYHKPNISFVGHQPHAQIPLWQKAADVLVIPNTAKEDISKYYTSPMKLFEYMASGTPIVASQIPSIEEIVTKDDVRFFAPDDPASLANAIRETAGETDMSISKTKNALKRVGSHTWTQRAERIIGFTRSGI